MNAALIISKQKLNGTRLASSERELEILHNEHQIQVQDLIQIGDLAFTNKNNQNV